MENVSPKYVTKHAIEGLVEKINLPAPDEYSQDWEYEVSDSSRLSELLSAYENIDLSTEEKFALMIVIISSFNDAIIENLTDDRSASLIKSLLLQDISIHRHTIRYWAMMEENDLENCHAVTPFIREIAYISNLDSTTEKEES
ncbi:hypothetical protein [Paenibacillus daejeonensis]|uniref:hypothetical protein n=1 Tax=Paenibacillus daejeonensis TaxID=135193 RepID=UPI0003747B30|nr:hypothetical protein [Paenibacillus daejeonensis]